MQVELLPTEDDGNDNAEAKAERSDGEFSPPPPPPLLPPSPLSPLSPMTTTIGKYIARFRNEQPLPREMRATVQRGEFWWKKAPHSRQQPMSHSSPISSSISSASSDGIVSMSLTGSHVWENSLYDHRQDSDETEKEQVEDEKAKRSVESPTMMRALDSFKLQIPDDDLISQLSEDESFVEDPELVIERVRQRLGWQTPSQSEPSSQSPFGARDTLIPRWFESADFVSSSLTNIQVNGNIESDANAIIASPVDAKGTMNQSVTSHDNAQEDESEMISDASTSNILATTLHDIDVNIDEECKAELISFNTEEKLADEVQGNEVITSSSVDEPVDVITAESADDDSPNVIATNSATEDAKDSPIDALPLQPHETDTSDVHSVSQNVNSSSLIENDTVASVEEASQISTARSEIMNEVPILQANSPILTTQTSTKSPYWSSYSESRDEPIVWRSNSLKNSSGSEQDDHLGDTAKTLDSLVSLVVHSWSEDYFFPFKEKNGNTNDVELDTARVAIATDEEESSSKQELAPVVDKSSSSTRSDPPKLLDDGDQDWTNKCSESKPDDLTNATSMEEDKEAEDKENESDADEDNEDEIVRMLIQRIALYEEALRRLER